MYASSPLALGGAFWLVGVGVGAVALMASAGFMLVPGRVLGALLETKPGRLGLTAMLALGAGMLLTDAALWLCDGPGPRRWFGAFDPRHGGERLSNAEPRCAYDLAHDGPGALIIGCAGLLCGALLALAAIRSVHPRWRGSLTPGRRWALAGLLLMQSVVLAGFPLAAAIALELHPTVALIRG